MGRSTHSDRSAAWAAKQGNPGYRTKKIIPSADAINRWANNSSFIQEKEILNKIETIKKED
jgi:hypothetical protein